MAANVSERTKPILALIDYVNAIANKSEDLPRIKHAFNKALSESDEIVMSGSGDQFQKLKSAIIKLLKTDQAIPIDLIICKIWSPLEYLWPKLRPALDTAQRCEQDDLDEPEEYWRKIENYINIFMKFHFCNLRIPTAQLASISCGSADNTHRFADLCGYEVALEGEAKEKVFKEQLYRPSIELLDAVISKFAELDSVQDDVVQGWCDEEEIIKVQDNIIAWLKEPTQVKMLEYFKQKLKLPKSPDPMQLLDACKKELGNPIVKDLEAIEKRLSPSEQRKALLDEVMFKFSQLEEIEKMGQQEAYIKAQYSLIAWLKGPAQVKLLEHFQQKLQLPKPPTSMQLYRACKEELSEYKE